MRSVYIKSQINCPCYSNTSGGDGMRRVINELGKIQLTYLQQQDRIYGIVSAV